MESKLPLVALFTVAVAACNWSDHREGAVFSHVTGDIVSFPTARLEASVARIQPPGQPSVGIVTPIPPDALFTQGLVPEAMIGKLKTLPDTEGWKVTPDNFVASPVFTDFLQPRGRPNS